MNKDSIEYEGQARTWLIKFDPPQTGPDQYNMAMAFIQLALVAELRELNEHLAVIQDDFADALKRGGAIQQIGEQLYQIDNTLNQR